MEAVRIWPSNVSFAMVTTKEWEKKLGLLRGVVEGRKVLEVVVLEEEFVRDSVRLERASTMSSVVLEVDESEALREERGD